LEILANISAISGRRGEKMQQDPKLRPMIEGGILSAVAIVFAFISAYVPVLGAFVNLIWPVPITLLGVRHGYKWSIMATVVAGIIIALLMHPLEAVSVVVGFSLIGIVLGHAIRARFSPVKTLLLGGAASLLSKMLVIGIGSVILGVNPLTMGTEGLDQTVDQALAMYRSIGIPETELAAMGNYMRSMLDIVKIILPAGFVLASLTDTYLNFWVAKIILKKLGVELAPFPPFKHWSFSVTVLYLFGISMGLIYLGNSNQLELVKNIGMNLNALSTILLLVQGVALFYFFADKYNLSRALRGIILVILFTGPFMQLLVFAGAFDIAVDYRRLRTPRVGG
jgi:uncharacterized protein YybS (DUF2232 family)